MDTEHSAIMEPLRRLEVFTGTGRTWRDEGGSDPPDVAYAPDRKAEPPIAHLEGFKGNFASRWLCRLP
jgi:hypothetical protein